MRPSVPLLRVRRSLLAAAVCLVVGLAAAPAQAKAIYGTARSEFLVGTKNPDQITAEGGGVDRIRCLGGRDIVTADPTDKVAADCEVVSLRVSHDPYRNSDSQHQTQVEPDSFSYGSTIVNTFQSGRYFDGGASNMGWATSTDGGKTWKSGFLPGVTEFSAPPGLYPRASDPTVAYDAVHGAWMISSLAFSPDANAMLISRSRDGTSWDIPVTAIRSETDLDFDKEWIVCDNWVSSPFRGNCYLTFADFGLGRLVTLTSRDGGLTWSPPVPSPDFGNGGSLNGSQPVVRPDGTLVILFSGQTTLGESISTDGGATFTDATTILSQQFLDVPAIRVSAFPSVEVDAAGTIYAAWNDCGLRPTCNGADIVLVSSTDGRRWSGPVRVPTGGRQKGHSYFTPGLAADPASPGHLGIVYYEMAPCACKIDVGFIGSANGGTSWGKPQRLSARSMKLGWLAATSLGLMTGDYISTSFVGGRPVPVFALSSPPSGGSLREAIFVSTRGIG
jgi:hypothetical protein